MEEVVAIEIGRGVGSVLFGASREEVTSILGQPEESELYEDEGTETWHYLGGKLSLSFDRESFWRFVSCESSDSATRLDGSAIVGRPLTEVLLHLEQQGAGRPESEPGPDEICLSYSDAALSLWSKDETVTSVAWGVRHDSEDRELWPDRLGDAI